MKRWIYIAVVVVALILSLISAYIYVPLFKVSTVGIMLVIILSLIGVIIPILSLILMKNEKMNLVFLVLNVVIILLAVFFYMALIGFGDGGIDGEVRDQIGNLFS